jgi:hypothetical protein
MKSKLSQIFKQIAKHEKKPPSPERIASEFMSWKRKRLSQEFYYFQNGKRNKSRDWKNFESLSRMLAEWRKRDLKIDLWTYFDSHLRRVGKNKNLYANQLVLKYSHEIMLGRDTVNPILVETVGYSSEDSEEYIYIDEELENLSFELRNAPRSEWQGIFDNVTKCHER